MQLWILDLAQSLTDLLPAKQPFNIVFDVTLITIVVLTQAKDLLNSGGKRFQLHCPAILLFQDSNCCFGQATELTAILEEFAQPELLLLINDSRWFIWFAFYLWFLRLWLCLLSGSFWLDSFFHLFLLLLCKLGLSLPLQKLALILFHLCHTHVMILVVKTIECLSTLDTSKAPCIATFLLAMSIDLLFF